MHIEELKGGEVGKEGGEGGKISRVVASDAKRVLVGAGARALFYPTLLYNVVRNKVQAEFRWWDKVDEFVLLGAVPFPVDVPQLKELGVRGVITLNESYETLVPTELYYAHGIDHLVIPTRDYCFAPSLRDICHAVNFIHANALSGRTTYVHCKAGRGRSTTIVVCYLVHHKLMTPDAAYAYVKSIRPRVLLASSQWQAVQEYYYHLMVRRAIGCAPTANLLVKAFEAQAAPQDLVTFDDSSVVMVTDSDLEGYDPSIQSGVKASDIWEDLSVVYRARVAGQAALARISCLWLRCGTNQKISAEELSRESSCTIRTNHFVDIHVY
ncbi:PREDICTED: putative dual specificity protein phosphatase DSP8 [Lupinus angustifolius]|uniref:putative dual specificity protein phosphatase DSP8 n=1 Tax=Lupinus angustifolius TaxID=3871 RepID=UPI00092F44C8|nr:PREDICTED: putative dual specificity protein phosphatase DSP8 [Lupinus angustifolius]